MAAIILFSFRRRRSAGEHRGLMHKVRALEIGIIGGWPA
jgi:hypothetical protein